MKTLSRFLIVMNSEINEIHSLQDYLTPKYFDATIKFYKYNAKYNKKKQTILNLHQPL